jgi:hypothetical protein
MFGKPSSAERYVMLWDEEHGAKTGDGISRTTDPKAALYEIAVTFTGMRPMREWLRATSKAEAAKFAANRYPNSTNIQVLGKQNAKRSSGKRVLG